MNDASSWPDLKAHVAIHKGKTLSLALISNSDGYLREGSDSCPLERRYSLDRHIAGFIPYGVASTPTWD